MSNQGEFVKFKSDYGTSVLINADTSISYKFGTPLLAIFTNKEGEFRIGNKMYLITEDNKLISFPIELKASSHSVRKSTISDKANGIEVRYYKAEKASKNPSVSSALWEPFNGIVKQELRYSGSRRLYIEIWRECIPSSDHPNDPDYFNYYLKLLQQSKKIWGWDANNTNYHMTDGRFKYQYAITTWGVPTVYTLETVPKETVNTMLEEYNNYDIRGAVYIGLFSGYNFGSFIGINALISSGGVPHNDSRYTFSNTYPSTLP